MGVSTTNSATISSIEPVAGALQFRNVTFGYGDDEAVLNDLSVTFRRDRISLITGVSGCGKSTLLYLAAGLLPHHGGILRQGSVSIEGTEPASAAPARRASLVGMMFQNPSLQFCMSTVEEELLFCFGNACLPRDEMPLAVERALERCGIRHLRSRVLRTLSGGEKQKVALACVLGLNPAWLLLDEPFANIDDASARELAFLIDDAHRTGIGVLIVDHRLDHWADIVDDLWRVDRGQIAPEPFPPYGSREERWRGWAERSGGNRISERAPVRFRLEEIEIHHGGVDVLSRLSASFDAGRIYAITGASGSGKSTLFDAMLGVVPYSGRMLLEGRPLHGRRRRLQPGSIGFVTQHPHDQFVADTVFDEIATGLTVTQHAASDIELEVERILLPVGLWGDRDVSPYMLSQGQQRRLGVAALLSYDCRVLICDEPTYAQDDENAMVIMDALVAASRDRGITVVFSTHDEVMARHAADVMLRLEGGQLHDID